ncbi:MAG: hypothetical protein OSB39_05465 [Opitutales bacterium]|nr:hypothetical protein [Opitutales bacterium]
MSLGLFPENLGIHHVGASHSGSSPKQANGQFHAQRKVLVFKNKAVVFS